MQRTTKDIPVTFRAAPDQVERFRRAAALDGISMSEWLRRLALLRLAEMGDRVNAEG